ncbi:MAG: DoxX family protein [Candidatus Pacebacteria bacterium]|jgi:hypothetical protein|nr:DoxX family protein [Candidatus Paceibacterota bacterium]MBP9780391.1 DoxX family protein [Candidatus Paceibacterota bacterium]
METLLIVLQLVAGLGIYNVWLLRPQMATEYRGKGARTLKDEFRAYGLPDGALYVVGTIKLVSATALLAGIWYPSFIIPSAAVLTIMMIGAISMHVKINDPIERSLPAFIMLSAVLGILYLV